MADLDITGTNKRSNAVGTTTGLREGDHGYQSGAQVPPPMRLGASPVRALPTSGRPDLKL